METGRADLRAQDVGPPLSRQRQTTTAPPATQRARSTTEQGPFVRVAAPGPSARSSRKSAEAVCVCRCCRCRPKTPSGSGVDPGRHSGRLARGVPVNFVDSEHLGCVTGWNRSSATVVGAGHAARRSRPERGGELAGSDTPHRVRLAAALLESERPPARRSPDLAEQKFLAGLRFDVDGIARALSRERSTRRGRHAGGPRRVARPAGIRR